MRDVFDVAIIGGGINGCGCAADAALRGLSVVLFEQDDIASKTSSSSTKLVHGGLRYLEHYEFKLVKKALAERQILLNLAPHLVHPQSLVLPYQQNMRPAWILRLGLFLYDHLSRKNKLPKCKSISRKVQNQYFAPLRPQYSKGFIFYDAATDDARLTLVNALHAKNHGAEIRPQTKIIKAEVINSMWQLSVQPKNGPITVFYAKSLINAAGPWVNSVAQVTHTAVNQTISLVKGSHILVPALYQGNHAYFLQHDDNRVIFIIPYHGYSMIGTTDVALQALEDPAKISDEEINYLIELVNSYFNTRLTREHMLHSWSGIRPLLSDEKKDSKALSRDYHYELSMQPAPVISIFGGKITTYRQLAEEVVDSLRSIFPHLPPSSTAKSALPGARFENMDFDQYHEFAQNKYSWLDKKLLHRYLYSYGTLTESFLGKCTHYESMGISFGNSLYQVEVDYLIECEWAKESSDILERRTKLGFELSTENQNKLENYLYRENQPLRIPS